MPAVTNFTTLSDSKVEYPHNGKLNIHFQPSIYKIYRFKITIINRVIKRKIKYIRT